VEADYWVFKDVSGLKGRNIRIAAPGRQMQGIAYSLDNGRTFTKYKDNPVIDSKETWDSGDTRDPKVFKYENHWVLVLNERDGHSIYNIPASDGRRIQIGWSRIGHPGMNFNGMMLLPVELTLRTTKDGPRLAGVPVREVEALCRSIGKWNNLSQEEANEALKAFSGKDCLRVRFTVELMADVYIDRTSAEVFVEDGLFSYSLPCNVSDKNAHEITFGGNRLKMKILSFLT